MTVGEENIAVGVHLMLSVAVCAILTYVTPVSRTLPEKLSSSRTLVLIWHTLIKCSSCFTYVNYFLTYVNLFLRTWTMLQWVPVATACLQTISHVRDSFLAYVRCLYSLVPQLQAFQRVFLQLKRFALHQNLFLIIKTHKELIVDHPWSNRNSFIDWSRNLRIILRQEKLEVLAIPCPPNQLGTPLLPLERHSRKREMTRMM